ncbi:putative clathrin assembly protein At4g40080 [Glycine soja]|uniref:Putative clathrin assembly protein n=2 Tax=Glycine soja TaxID=3848 RepID=A0A445H7L4_GLYSO|nr:putative clathrin assembly protein At4g40080 [Glycine soja]RZB69567.1 putative clathrin assembly protein [Glycine soja]
MSLRKRLRNLGHNLKDKASVIAASLSLKRHVSSVRIHVLHATTHRLSAPPSTSQIAAVLSAGKGSYLLSRTCIDTIMDRLHRTRSATVALKCLFTLHNIVSERKGPLTLKDNLSHYPSNGGRNALNVSTFRDDTDVETMELSAWVRWYANVLEHVLTVSRVLGYYLINSNDGTREVFSSVELFREIRGLVDFVEQVSHAPESLHLQKIELVFNVVRLVCEDYGRVQREILRRVEEGGNRVEDLDVGELREFVRCMKRLEGCREKLVVLFVNRKRNDAFWDLIGKVKYKGVEVMEEMEGKWLMVVKKGMNELAESTRFANPFLEPGEFMYSGPTGWRVATCQPVPTVG